MLARIDVAFVSVNVTSFSLVTVLAETLKPVYSIRTSPSIYTRIALAFIDVGSTQVVIVTMGAVTPE